MSVIDNIYMIVDDYQRETNKRPAALVLGPREYKALCDYVSRNNQAMRDTQVFGNLVTEFIGLPVYLKELPGIDLMIPHVDVMRYV